LKRTWKRFRLEEGPRGEEVIGQVKGTQKSLEVEIGGGYRKNKGEGTGGGLGGISKPLLEKPAKSNKGEKRSKSTHDGGRGSRGTMKKRNDAGRIQKRALGKKKKG